MKYIFDLTFNKDHYDLKIELNMGNQYSSPVSFPLNEDAESFEKVAANLIDNMRLTVNERYEARSNTSVLVDYLKYYFNKAEENTEQIINEEHVSDNEVIENLISENEQEQ